MKSIHLSAVAVLGLAVASTPMVAAAKSITVRPNQSIQAAVNAAKPGDTVKVLSGVYQEPVSYFHSVSRDASAAVLITKSIRLIASGQVTIVPSQDQENGIVVLGTAANHVNGVEIRGFTVDGFHDNGIWLEYVDNFNIENNVSANNGENGIWPTLSANGQVKKNVAYGSKDSALWVEASENVRVFNNELYGSPTGLEVTLSKDLLIANNNVHDNTVGIGLYHPAAAGLPQDEWPTYDFGNWHVVNNHVHNNNMVNPVGGEGEVALLPPGLGMLILGVDDVTVQQNWVEKNDFVGVALLDWCLAALEECVTEGVPTGFEDTALDNNRVVANKFAGNHTATSFPPTVPDALAALKSDILYVDGLMIPVLAPPEIPPEYLPPAIPGSSNCHADNKLIKTPNPHDPGVLMYTVPPEGVVGFDLFPTCE